MFLKGGLTIQLAYIARIYLFTSYLIVIKNTLYVCHYNVNGRSVNLSYPITCFVHVCYVYIKCVRKI